MVTELGLSTSLVLDGLMYISKSEIWRTTSKSLVSGSKMLLSCAVMITFSAALNAFQIRRKPSWGNPQIGHLDLGYLNIFKKNATLPLERVAPSHSL